MKKADFHRKAKDMGDFYLYYKKEDSNNTTYLVGTTDLTTKYVASRLNKKLVPAEDEILVWSWSSNKLRKLKLDRIQRLVPLGSVLRNRK